MAWSMKKYRAVKDYLATHPCVDCGNDDERVLEFDHVDPQLKIDNIGRCICSMGMENLMDEIAKCEVRCANCHAIKHYKERHK